MGEGLSYALFNRKKGGGVELYVGNVNPTILGPKMSFSNNIFSLISVTLGKKSVTQLAICYFHVPSMEKSVTKSTTEHLFI